MNRSIKLIIILIICFCITLPVNAASDYYKNINVKFNHNGCNYKANQPVTFQLFADGKKVEGKEVTLNKNTGYSYTYENLQIFKTDSPDLIRYEVKVLKNGEYFLISNKNYSYEKKHLKKWVQVPMEDIKAGHTYVITTDNWNYENNGFSKTIYLRGDITAKGAPVEAEYNIIDGKQSYYVLNGEPIENTKWVVSNVPTSDPNYNEFKDYLMFTNEAPEQKKLTLTGYKNGSSINYIYKRSGQTGLIDENTYNSNRVILSPVPKSKGRFYIGTHTKFPDIENVPQYITLSGQNQYQAGSDIERGAQFKAFEYIDKEVDVGVTVNVEESLCDKDTIVIDKNADYQKKINVNFDCTGCENKKEKGITIQLFINGKKVEDGQRILNTKNGFKYTYDNLPYFKDDSTIENKYDVKVLLNGKYYSLPQNNVKNKTENIKSWVQVLPNDIKAGHTYVITTENLNYETNGFSHYIYLRGDVTAKGAQVETKYNVIDGKKLYYILNGEPIENTKWVASNVPTTDPDYNTFKEYIMFTNEGGKNLTLTGYNSSNGINFIYKYSGKNGYIDSEDAMYTNKVAIIPANNSNGKFYIGTKNLFPEPNNMMQYLSLSTNNQYQANPDINNAAQFMIYEYIEKRITLASEIDINSSLCQALRLADKPIVNPKTGVLYLTLLIIIIIIGISAYMIKRKEKISEEEQAIVIEETKEE